VRAIAVVWLVLVAWVPAAGAWTWPVAGPVLAPFSFDAAHPYAGGQHRGIDIGAATGAPVAAPAPGEVTFAGSVPSSGKTLSILTADALSVTLTHLGSLAVAKGETVAEGEVVGTVGPSGTPELSVPFVHLGVRAAAEEQGYLDPLSFLPAAAAVAAPPAVPAPAPPAPPPAVEPAAPPPAAEPSPADPAPDPGLDIEPASGLTIVPARVPAPRTLAHAMRPVPAAAAVPVAPTRVSSRRASRAAVARPHVRRAHAAARSARTQPVAHRPVRAVPPSRAGHVLVVRVSQHNGAYVRVWLVVAAALALLLAVLGVGARMIIGPLSQREGARTVGEDPRRAGLAVWQRPPAHRPCGGLRRAGGRLRALSPAQGRRRADGERDGRARHAGHGRGRSSGRVAA
jgi:hypothetical protein